MTEQHPAQARNIVFFVAAVLFFGNLFGYYFYSANGFGGLAFILSPIVMALGLRAFAGDGWRDAGFRLNLRGNIGVYGVAFLLFPILMGGTLGLGWLIGDVVFQPGAGTALIGTFAISLPFIFAVAFFEEVGWRGYLEPRLKAVGVPAVQRHLSVGLVWAAWHIGYILSHPEDYNHLSTLQLIVLTLVGISAMSVIYGAMRTVTVSVCPAMIVHGMGNLLAWPMVDGAAVLIETPLVFAARADSLLMIAALLVGAGFALRWEMRCEQKLAEQRNSEL